MPIRVVAMRYLILLLNEIKNNLIRGFICDYLHRRVKLFLILKSDYFNI
jgi:hypothetical protein